MHALFIHGYLHCVSVPEQSMTFWTLRFLRFPVASAVVPSMAAATVNA